MSVKFGVIQFPGSCDEADTLSAVRLVGDGELLWHKDRDLKGSDVVVVPGGFSYGDYLRVGAIARFSPVMEAVAEHAENGGLVLGICNGFQVLCEAGMLPGALLTNTELKFTCRQVDLEVTTNETALTSECNQGDLLSVPAKHTTGRYFAPPEMLQQIEDNGQVVLRYAQGQCFNGSSNDIAGICNRAKNVFGLMPHPEHAVDDLVGGSTGGLKLFQSLAASATKVAA